MKSTRLAIAVSMLLLLASCEVTTPHGFVVKVDGDVAAKAIGVAVSKQLDGKITRRVTPR